MNPALTEEIVKHILFNLSVLSNDFVKGGSPSLKDTGYQLPVKLNFETDDVVVKNKVWGCQFVFEQKTLRILLGDSSICDDADKENYEEYCLIVHLEGMPTYGLYICAESPNAEPAQAMIAFSIDGKVWAQCSTYLQATFLAAMEQIKDGIVVQKRCDDYNNEYQSMLTFLQYHTNTFEDDYEGQES